VGYGSLVLSVTGYGNIQGIKQEALLWQRDCATRLSVYKKACFDEYIQINLHSAKIV